jgi:hypothetical protein
MMVMVECKTLDKLLCVEETRISEVFSLGRLPEDCLAEFTTAQVSPPLQVLVCIAHNKDCKTQRQMFRQAMAGARRSQIRKVRRDLAPACTKTQNGLRPGPTKGDVSEQRPAN